MQRVSHIGNSNLDFRLMFWAPAQRKIFFPPKARRHRKKKAAQAFAQLGCLSYSTLTACKQLEETELVRAIQSFVARGMKEAFKNQHISSSPNVCLCIHQSEQNVVIILAQKTPRAAQCSMADIANPRDGGARKVISVPMCLEKCDYF